LNVNGASTADYLSPKLGTKLTGINQLANCIYCAISVTFGARIHSYHRVDTLYPAIFMASKSNMSATLTIPKKKLTWLMTGCSSGFGLSLTRFAQAGGHTVIATSRNLHARLASLQKSRAKEGNGLL
jgi:hypothetical protein